MKINLKLIKPFIAQILILIICITVLSISSTFSKNLINFIIYSPYIVFSLGIILSILFNRSRIFFIILCLLITQILLNNYSSLSLSYKEFSETLYPIICIFLPINIALFSQLKESGIFSLWGKMKFIFIAVQLYCVFMLMISSNPSITSFLNYKLPIPFSLKLGTVNNFVYLCIILFIILKAYFNKSTNEITILFLLILTIISLSLISNKTASALFFSAVGFILIISIMEVSYSMAYLDELTRIPSRRALKEAQMKLGSKYVITMIDIDNFKNFNDTYGHDIGDEVLKLVAANLADISGGGKAFRFGGEEFTLLFPGKTITEVMPHLESIREKVSKASYTPSPKKASTPNTRSRTPKKLSVTISLGVAERNLSHKTPTEVLEAADKALYRAKNKGRNCVSK
jgi:diguanylate cyclase (GGDEF)-like protein